MALVLSPGQKLCGCLGPSVAGLCCLVLGLSHGSKRQGLTIPRVSPELREQAKFLALLKRHVLRWKARVLLRSGEEGRAG